MIKIKNLVKVYKGETYETRALDGIDLTIEDGEFVAVMGPSGSGKSTLLNVIGCMDTLTEGEYYLDDYEIHKLKLKELHKVRREKISFVFQHFALMSNFSVYENVEVPLLAKNVNKSRRKKIVYEKLKMLGIDNLADKLPTQISGGQQQRAAIARALTSDNDIILADEPTGALDRKTGQDLMNMLTDINALGKTIIVVTHDDKVASATKRIINIVDGRITGDERNA
ncbi:ABC transporter ATP-binding protein [Mahella australiensis]|jgi:putative ABC transport system ATP-binding protein|uniref:ABC transporter related protein n=1 Tax=Mahella australiensis (strain DSM 15567 / CIP 107919 / 50-1 BON) TaxID=697281 RepID=F4A024_MAHA5|nr:ABC transporter ATP-binding protein [Mahella australiensis]AEE95842.1 ABC transporter related protein [Mahella australiensis 50-1 BON]